MSITRVDPASGTTSLSTFNIPQAHQGRGSASTPQHGYLFGGFDPTTQTFKDTIIRFTP